MPLSFRKLLLLPLLMLMCTGCSSGYTPIETVSVSPQRPQRIEPPSQEVAVVDINKLGWTTGKVPKVLVVLDPGHGGEDYGTNSNGKPKFYEKYLNLSTALQVKQFLEQRGYRVEMTRTDDTFISLGDRAQFANRLGATVFVSIHYNSGPSKDAEGLEVFYYQDPENKTRVAQSKLLAKAALDNIIKQTDVKSRGVKNGNYAVLRNTEMPAILIEGGFLTNDAEMEKIKTSAYQKQMAQGITRGIVEYLAKMQLMPQ